MELNGADLRREPIEVRKATLASILRQGQARGALNERAVVFQHACKRGLEGIVCKRLGSRYRSGRSPDRLKFMNPQRPAVKREAEEDWGYKRALSPALQTSDCGVAPFLSRKGISLGQAALSLASRGAFSLIAPKRTDSRNPSSARVR